METWGLLTESSLQLVTRWERVESFATTETIEANSVVI